MDYGFWNATTAELIGFDGVLEERKRSQAGLQGRIE
jgi:hypothetical protein